MKSLKQRNAILKNSISKIKVLSPLGQRIRKHFTDVNDVITEDDIRNVQIGLFPANAPEQQRSF
jgi:hypothetical protein